MKEKTVMAGFGIVVVDRGYVYVGEIEHTGKWCIVKNAQNIRRWGTSRGLGELALSGPTAETKLDPSGTIRIPAKALITIIDSVESKWQK